eukprot:2673074-Pleurochrysis_carterae.AAC.1
MNWRDTLLMGVPALCYCFQATRSPAPLFSAVVHGLRQTKVTLDVHNDEFCRVGGVSAGHKGKAIAPAADRGLLAAGYTRSRCTALLAAEHALLCRAVEPVGHLVPAVVAVQDAHDRPLLRLLHCESQLPHILLSMPEETPCALDANSMKTSSTR